MKFLTRSVLILALAVSAFGQSPAQCYSGSQVIQPCTPLTDAIYWASKDPRIVALQQLVTPTGAPDQGARVTAAQALDAQGLIIDRVIDIIGWDPLIVMQTRGDYGYPWVPNAFQPDLIDPLKLGVVPAGSVATDMTTPWPRSIKVSTLASDYPPIIPPKPVSPPNDNVTWYFDAASGTYGVIQAAVTDASGNFIYKEGQALMYKGQTVYFHLSYSIMGVFPQFVLTKP